MQLKQRIKLKIIALRKRFARTESEKLFKCYANVPRFTPLIIEFRNLRFETPDALSVLHQLDEVFIKEKMRFTPKRDEVVIYDCGANVGVVTKYFQQQFPKVRVVALEADPAITPYFKKNIAPTNDVTLIEKAAWIDNNGMPFGSEGSDGGSVFYPHNRTKVASIRLKELIAEESHIDLLKVDIEGAEVAVLKDCQSELKKIDHLLVEYHSWKNRPQELDELLVILTKAGFRYILEEATNIVHPFVETARGNMDLQINIYAYRIEN